MVFIVASPLGGSAFRSNAINSSIVGSELNTDKKESNQMSETSTLISYSGRVTRAELAQLPTPPATPTHIPIPHVEVVEALIGTLRLRHIGAVSEEVAVSRDGMEMFGVLDLETTLDGCRFAVGIRNANNKRFRLSCTFGLRVFVCEHLAFQGDYTPVLAKHSKNFSLKDSLSTGANPIKRNFKPLPRP